MAMATIATCKEAGRLPFFCRTLCAKTRRHMATEALACFGYCVSLGVGDIHNLDGDGDGIERESLCRQPLTGGSE